jgi:hypothetical protein
MAEGPSTPTIAPKEYSVKGIPPGLRSVLGRELQLCCDPIGVGEIELGHVLEGDVVVRIELLEDFLWGMTARHIDDFVGGQGAVWREFLPIRFEPDLRLSTVNPFC